MNEIQVNLILRTLPEAPFSGTYRIVLVNRQTDSVWLIAIAPPGAKRQSYQCRPKRHSLGKIEELVRLSQVEVGEGELPAQWLLSDAQIQSRYQRKNSATKSSQLSLRDSRWGVIAPILGEYTTFELLEGGRYHWALVRRAKELGVPVKNVAFPLHLYWAGACSMNALLPRYYNSGAKGKLRVQRQKIGAPNVAVRNGYAGVAGYIVTDDDRKNLRFGWENYLRPGKTVQSAYKTTMEAFYRAGEREKDGWRVPILKPAHKRPTLRQFRYWGEGGRASHSASMLQLSNGEFEKRYRALPGTARDGLQAVAQLAYCDATSTDVHLVSAVSRARPVGIAHRILIVDGYTGLWAGLYCGFDPPSARTALMAVANAALDKVDFCARFDIAITPDMWPAIAFNRYLADNGEFRAEKSIKPITGFGSTLEFAPIGRADLKGPVESSHRVMQSRIDHKLDGTTHGRRRERGEDHPAINGALTYFEYMRLLIRVILHRNNVERCEHLLTTEMRRDCVKPTRASIYQWCLKNGYVGAARPNADMVRAHLFPALPAVLTGHGVYLVRPDRGRRTEYVRGARFDGDVLHKEGLMVRARNNHEEIEVRGDPQDLRKVWLVRDSGVHALGNALANDPLAIKEWTLADHLAVQDDDALDRQLARGEQEQSVSELDAFRFAETDAANKEKQQEVMRQNKRPSKRALTSNIRQNRTTEKDLMQKASLTGGNVAKLPTVSRENATTTKQAAPGEPSSAPTNCTTAAVDLIRQFRKRRILK